MMDSLNLSIKIIPFTKDSTHIKFIFRRERQTENITFITFIISFRLSQNTNYEKQTTKY